MRVVWWQVELNKKREAELQRMKRDLEEQQLQHEQAITTFKKKNQDAQNELNDQLDQLSKLKSKCVPRDVTSLSIIATPVMVVFHLSELKRSATS